MTTWIFTHPDTWTLAADPSFAWEEGETDTAFMARLGYASHSRARNSDVVDFVGSWSLWTAQAADAPYDHALLLDGEKELGVLVWLPTLPDLLAYIVAGAKFKRVTTTLEEITGCEFCNWP